MELDSTLIIFSSAPFHGLEEKLHLDDLAAVFLSRMNTHRMKLGHYLLLTCFCRIFVLIRQLTHLSLEHLPNFSVHVHYRDMDRV